MMFNNAVTIDLRFEKANILSKHLRFFYLKSTVTQTHKSESQEKAEHHCFSFVFPISATKCPTSGGECLPWFVIQNFHFHALYQGRNGMDKRQRVQGRTRKEAWITRKDLLTVSLCPPGPSPKGSTAFKHLKLRTRRSKPEPVGSNCSNPQGT